MPTCSALNWADRNPTLRPGRGPPTPRQPDEGLADRPDEGSADLLDDGWQALRRDGDLTLARDLFDRAARLAESRSDADAFGEAALGASGLWLHEHRSAVDQARIRGWREAALGVLDPSSTLARRLRLRQAAEADYAEGDTRRVLAQLEEVVRSGDDTAIAEVLHVAQHCLLGPKYGELRMTLADQLLSVAATTGDPYDCALGLLWRTTNLHLLGDPHADRALTAFRAALHDYPHLALRYVLSGMDVMVAIRAGDLGRAEELAERSAEQGREAGDADVLGWYGAHLVSIRYFQGRGHELTPMLQELVASPELSEPNDAFLGALATAASMGGDTWAAASALSRLRRPTLAALRQNSIWLVTLFGAVLAADLLDLTEVAEEAYELLLPYAELPATASLAITCMGSTHYPLGIAASTMGRWDLAAQHFRQAVVANEALGHRPAHVTSEAALANALARTGDLDGSGRVMARATANATQLGMTGWLSTWPGVDERDSQTVECVRDGPRWALTAVGRRVTVDDSLGMRYLAQLVTHPGLEISALDLAGGRTNEGPMSGGNGHDLLDADAKRAYRVRLSALQERIEAADSVGDAAAAETAHAELDWLVQELKHATGLGGRGREFPHDAERARTSVQKAIRRALAHVSASDPTIGGLLEATIATGYRCAYRPVRD